MLPKVRGDYTSGKGRTYEVKSSRVTSITGITTMVLCVALHMLHGPTKVMFFHKW